MSGRGGSGTKNSGAAILDLGMEDRKLQVPRNKRPTRHVADEPLSISGREDSPLTESVLKRMLDDQIQTMIQAQTQTIKDALEASEGRTDQKLKQVYEKLQHGDARMQKLEDPLATMQEHIQRQDASSASTKDSSSGELRRAKSTLIIGLGSGYQEIGDSRLLGAENQGPQARRLLGRAASAPDPGVVWRCYPSAHVQEKIQGNSKPGTRSPKVESASG